MLGWRAGFSAAPASVVQKRMEAMMVFIYFLGFRGVATNMTGPKIGTPMPAKIRYADLDEGFSFEFPEFPEAGKKTTESGIHADFQSHETADSVGIHGVTDAQEAC
jgi:hypothetical protein